jgi:hypothetical protein
MVRLDVQKRIIEKAFRENPVPFAAEGETYTWKRPTRVKSKATEKTYQIYVEISLTPSRRLNTEVTACLCKTEGVRFEDLVIVSMIDPKIRGTIHLRGLPKGDEVHDFGKFVKKVSKAEQ